jgi:hypothetical protein
MFKEFLMKKMLKAKGVPEDQIEMVMTLVEKNPQLFTKIAEEIQARVKNGEDQTKASMDVMMKYKDEVQKVMAEIKK